MWGNDFWTDDARYQRRRLFNVYYTDLSNEEKKELSFRDMLPVALAAMMESAAELFRQG